MLFFSFLCRLKLLFLVPCAHGGICSRSGESCSAEAAVGAQRLRENRVHEFPSSAAALPPQHHCRERVGPALFSIKPYLCLLSSLIICIFIFFYSFRTTGWQKTSNTNNIVHCYQSKTERQDSRSTSPAFSPERSQSQQFDRVSQGSYSSLVDPVDPTTITKTYKAGRKASAQANLASRSKTPNKARRRLNKARNKNNGGMPSDMDLLYFM